MNLIIKVAIAAMLHIGFVGLAQADEGATGVWIMENGKITVRIDPCGPNLCGAIVGMAKPLNKEGKPKLDRKNPNEALRSRPVIGLTILTNMKPSGKNKWNGIIYNADDGRTYSSYMKLSGSNMKVKGCVGPFCKTMKFVRAN